jgi:hypothetical protein
MDARGPILIGQRAYLFARQQVETEKLMKVMRHLFWCPSSVRMQVQNAVKKVHEGLNSINAY